MRFLLSVSLLISAAAASAKVATIDLKRLTTLSPLIVVGKVTALRTDGFRFATIRIEQTIKGHAPKEVEFIASPTWRCDITTAHVGERILLFLSPKKADPDAGTMLGQKIVLKKDTYAISHSGRGRIVLNGAGSASTIQFKPESWMEPTEYCVNLRLPTDLPYTRKQGTVTLPTELLIARVEKYSAASQQKI